MFVKTVDLLLKLINYKILFNFEKIIEEGFLVFSYGSERGLLFVEVGYELVEVVDEVEAEEFL